MSKCAYCGVETELSSGETPVCEVCDQRRSGETTTVLAGIEGEPKLPQTYKRLVPRLVTP
jgi:hypothetical protein